MGLNIEYAIFVVLCLLLVTYIVLIWRINKLTSVMRETTAKIKRADQNIEEIKSGIHWLRVAAQGITAFMRDTKTVHLKGTTPYGAINLDIDLNNKDGDG